ARRARRQLVTARRRAGGVQAEVLVSLALITATATAVLAGVLLRTQAAQLEQASGLIGRSLLAETRAPTFLVAPESPGTRWWIVDSRGLARHRSGQEDPLPDALRELVGEARERSAPVIRTGMPWQPVRFATPLDSGGRVAVAEIGAATSGLFLLFLVVADALVFTAFGLSLLQRRVVQPLSRLAAAARGLALDGPGTRVHVEGVGEATDVANAFNEMSDALERRTGALEKAVSDLREANDRLQQARQGLDRAERLAAVGRLAAGVAHEVGNPMGALLAFLDLARRDSSIAPETATHLRKASEQGARVRQILRQLLDFSRPPRAVHQGLEVRPVVDEVVGLIRAQKRYADVEIAIEEAEGIPGAWGDEAILAQILLNLVLNAVDAALAGAAPSRVLVSLAPAVLHRRAGDAPETALERQEPDGVACRVADTGLGVSPENHERIFDPFFTTKPPGEGTGLGLANAQRLAEELGGSLELHPPGELGGAVFVLQIPTHPPVSARVRERGDEGPA
ncbi:MAG: ATP-binding protein, partial [Proteobacteria bacterium]|nr:ATP-binding protein [Pseudomonadota bacterium]